MNNTANLTYKTGKVIEEKEFTIKIANDKLDLDRIEVSKDTKLILHIENINNNQDSTFEIEGYKITQTIPKGTVETLFLNTYQAGEFEYGFKNSRIKGILVVN